LLRYREAIAVLGECRAGRVYIRLVADIGARVGLNDLVAVREGAGPRRRHG